MIPSRRHMFIVYLYEPGLVGTADAWEYTVSILTPTKKSTDRWNTKFITHEAAPRCWIDFGSNMSKIDIKVCECWWGVSAVYGHSPDGSTICCWPCKHWHGRIGKKLSAVIVYSVGASWSLMTFNVRMTLTLSWTRSDIEPLAKGSLTITWYSEAHNVFNDLLTYQLSLFLRRECGGELDLDSFNGCRASFLRRRVEDITDIQTIITHWQNNVRWANCRDRPYQGRI